MEIRDIIQEACTRVNICPRRQAVPGDIVENAYRLLKGIVAKYNSDNLLCWTQKSVVIPKSTLIHIYDETDVVKGQNNLYFDTVEQLHAYTPSEEEYENNTWAMIKDQPNSVYVVYSPAPNVYDWHYQDLYDNNTQRIQEMREYCNMLHFQVRDVAKINSVYVISDTNEPYKEYYKLDFINHTDFDRYSRNARVYTYTQKSEGEWLINVKPLYYPDNHRLKITYNEAMQFDIDSDLFIPENYIELLIVALAHKLALMYPRLDESQMNRLENEVRVLVDNVRTPKAEDRVLLRNNYWDSPHTMTQAELLAGYGMF